MKGKRSDNPQASQRDYVNTLEMRAEEAGVRDFAMRRSGSAKAKGRRTAPCLEGSVDDTQRSTSSWWSRTESSETDTGTLPSEKSHAR